MMEMTMIKKKGKNKILMTMIWRQMKKESLSKMPLIMIMKAKMMMTMMKIQLTIQMIQMAPKRKRRRRERMIRKSRMSQLIHILLGEKPPC